MQTLARKLWKTLVASARLYVELGTSAASLLSGWAERDVLRVTPRSGRAGLARRAGATSVATAPASS